MKQPERTLVICNGEPPSRALVRRLARRVDEVIAADGGANTARLVGIRPDIIIGDLDSITAATKRFFASSVIMRVDDQDSTDLEKVLDFLSARGTPEAIIVGATGKRIDFTLGNLSVLWNYMAFLRMSVVGDGWRAMPVGRSVKVKARPGTTVSLIPFGLCSGITIRGLRWPLSNASMGSGEIGVSNVVRSSPFTVSVRRGNMLLIVMA